MKNQSDLNKNKELKCFNPRIGTIPIKLMAFPKLSSNAKLLWIRLVLELDEENEIHSDDFDLRPESIGMTKTNTDKAFQELWEKGFIIGCMSNTGLPSWTFAAHECLE